MKNTNTVTTDFFPGRDQYYIYIIGCFYGFVVPGAPKGSTGRLILLLFLEKPGIEPATPGLQGERLNNCTTEASFQMLVYYGDFDN